MGLHETNSTVQEMANPKFDNPFLSFFKTITMFIGEFDFENIKMMGGDISVSMSHIVLFMFTFLMVVVLMNVLNGLAVSDTRKMIKDCMVLSQISNINTIHGFESFYLGLIKIHRLFGTHPSLAKKFFLFQSSYLKDMKLSLPFKRKGETGEPKKDICSKLFKVCEQTDKDLDREGFLIKARDILRHLKVVKQRERRQSKLIRQLKQMRKSSLYNKKIENFENVLKLSFSQQHDDSDQSHDFMKF